MKNQHPRLPRLCVGLAALIALLPASLSAVEPAQTTNPIGRVARIFNHKLVEVEDRIRLLERRQDALAMFAEKPLNESKGWRCGQYDPTAGKPWIALDLGREVPLDQVFL